MQLNKTKKAKKVYTKEGGRTRAVGAVEQLRRAMYSCLLWESNFYESGESIADRISNLVQEIRKTEEVEEIIRFARHDIGLRHAPLLAIRAMLKSDKHKKSVRRLLKSTIRRPDGMSEFLAIYWNDNESKKIPAQVRRGLADTFSKFDEYQLAKYNRNNKEIKLVDVMNLVHPKPRNKEQAELWGRLLANTLKTPDTWEVAISAIPKDNKDAREKEWNRLITEKRLGALALIRNIRNMMEDGVDNSLIISAIKEVNLKGVLPYQMVRAVKAANSRDGFDEEVTIALEDRLKEEVQDRYKLDGKTVILLDISGSMHSTNNAVDSVDLYSFIAAHGCADPVFYTFSEDVVKVGLRRRDSMKSVSEKIWSSQRNWSTYMARAIKHINRTEDYDRIIIITDEQSHDGAARPLEGSKAYILNLQTHQVGVGYEQGYVHINGFTPNLFRYIKEIEG